MRRWIPLLLIFATLAALAIWLLVRDASDIPLREVAAVDEVEPSEVVASPATPDPEDFQKAETRDGSESGAQPGADGSIAPSVEESEGSVGEPMEMLRGRLIVVDAEGTESRSESGTMRVFVSVAAGGGFSVGRTVEVERGAWAIAMRSGVDNVRELRIHEIELGERSAVREGNPYDPVEVRPGELVIVRAQWKRATLLHVLDATTGVSLDEVEIRARDEGSSSSHEHPGVLHERVLVESGASPLEIDAGEGRASRTIFVGRPGYAWTTVEVAPSGGERTVKLERGGALRIRLDRDDDTIPMIVRVYSIEDDSASTEESVVDDVQKRLREMAPDEMDEMLSEIDAVRASASPEEIVMLDGFEALLRSGGSAETISGLLEMFDSSEPIGVPMIEFPAKGRDIIDLDGMSPGHFAVRAELGDWFHDPTVFASETANVPPGGRGEAALAWRAPEVPDTASLVLKVECPVAWAACGVALVYEMRRVTLEFQGNSKTGSERWRRLRTDEPREVGGLFEFEFDPVDLEPGRYEIEVEGIEFTSTVNIAEGEKAERVVRLPEPARVVLSVVEAGTGVPITEGDVRWYPRRLFGSGGGGSNEASRVSGSNRFEFCAPLGGIEIRHDGRYQAYGNFFVQSGTNELTLEVYPTSVISFTLKHGETKIPFDSFPEYEVEVLEGSARLMSYGSSSIRVVSPGHYRIGLPQVTGFEPIPPFEVRVAKGEDIHREVELVPLR